MKKISSKALLITGLIVEFGNPFFIFCIAFLFPNLSADVVMSIIITLDCLGVIILVFSLAKYRIEKGKTKSENPIRALTPAQIVLVLSMLLLIIIMIFDAFENDVLDGVDVVALFGIFTSVVLAIVRAIKTFIRSKKTISTGSVTTSSSDRNRPKYYCDRCGAAGDKEIFLKMNGKKICKSCAEFMILAQNSELLKSNAKCCVCGNEFEKRKMIIVDDQYICNNCFRSRYDGSSPIEDNTESL